MARVIAICNQKGGVGKCMAPGTPVLLASGETMPIERFFDEGSGGNAIRHFDESGGAFVRPVKPVRVFSLDDDFRVVEETVDWAYRGKAQRLFEVKSSGGKVARVTPEHPFLTYRNGQVAWVRAEALQEGDHVAAPRNVPVVTDQSNTDLTPYIPGDILVRLTDREIIAKNFEAIVAHGGTVRDALLSRFLRGNAGAKELYGIANEGVVFKYLRQWLRNGVVSRRAGKRREFIYSLNRERAVDEIMERGFSIVVFRALALPHAAVRDFVYMNASGHACPPMRPTFTLDADLARFVALVIAEGYLGPSRIIFFNSSRELVDIFTDYCARIGLPQRQERLDTQWKVTVDGAGTLMKFLDGVFGVPRGGDRKSSRVRIPQTILRAPREILAAYLGAYIDGEGYVARDRPTLEIASASYENVVGLQYAFLRFGVNARLRSKYSMATNSPQPKRRLYHMLTMTGVRDLKALLDAIPLAVSAKRERLVAVCAAAHNTNIDVVPGGDLIRSVRNKLGLLQREIGLQGTITDYEDGSSDPSNAALRKITAVMERSPLFSSADPEMALLFRLANADVFWEQVASVTPLDYDGYVYDLTVARSHNFIAGYGALVMHNTTTAVNLSAYLAANGKRTLLVDFDPQANASSALGKDPLRTYESVYHGILGQAEPAHLVHASELDRLHLIPAAPHLAGALVELIDQPEREYFLRRFLTQLRHQYDYIIIDLPPSLSLLVINGMVAADELIIPVQAEYYSLEGLGQLLETIDLLRNNLGHRLEVAGALLTMFDRREHLSQEIGKNLRRHFPYRVFDTEIPRSVALAEAPSFSKPILLYRPDSNGALAYRRLAEEVIRQERELRIPAEEVAASANFGNFNI